MAITVNTNPWQWSHAGPPRGYGGWGFTLSAGAAQPYEVWTQGWYGASLREAKRIAREEGFDTVTVLP